VKPELSSRFDYEGELALVVGRGGRYIRAEHALDAIAGYTIVMDGTAREWQRASSQWTPGKNFDGTMPIGPEVVTTDELDASDLQLTTTLNGEVMQSASTAQMIFDIRQCVEYVSSFTTLRPGDVIATGTPGGVGFARTPPVWLQPGDLLEVAVDGLGRIANRVVAEDGDRAEWPWVPPVSDKATF
jgi:2-keto-4-pentenoate hydratase/2-oxohepta-3-ene-1,7-dioic acid hydratase in catechol pathway